MNKKRMLFSFVLLLCVTISSAVMLTACKKGNGGDGDNGNKNPQKEYYSFSNESIEANDAYSLDINSSSGSGYNSAYDKSSPGSNRTMVATLTINKGYLPASDFGLYLNDTKLNYSTITYGDGSSEDGSSVDSDAINNINRTRILVYDFVINSNTVVKVKGEINLSNITVPVAASSDYVTYWSTNNDDWKKVTDGEIVVKYGTRVYLDYHFTGDAVDYNSSWWLPISASNGLVISLMSNDGTPLVIKKAQTGTDELVSWTRFAVIANEEITIGTPTKGSNQNINYTSPSSLYSVMVCDADGNYSVDNILKSGEENYIRVIFNNEIKHKYFNLTVAPSIEGACVLEELKDLTSVNYNEDTFYEFSRVYKIIPYQSSELELRSRTVENGKVVVGNERINALSQATKANDYLAIINSEDYVNLADMQASFVVKPSVINGINANFGEVLALNNGFFINKNGNYAIKFYLQGNIEVSKDSNDNYTFGLNFYNASGGVVKTFVGEYDSQTGTFIINVTDISDLTGSVSAGLYGVLDPAKQEQTMVIKTTMSNPDSKFTAYICEADGSLTKLNLASGQTSIGNVKINSKYQIKIVPKTGYFVYAPCLIGSTGQNEAFLVYENGTIKTSDAGEVYFTLNITQPNPVIEICRDGSILSQEDDLYPLPSRIDCKFKLVDENNAETGELIEGLPYGKTNVKFAIYEQNSDTGEFEKVTNKFLNYINIANENYAYTMTPIMPDANGHYTLTSAVKFIEFSSLISYSSLWNVNLHLADSIDNCSVYYASTATGGNFVSTDGTGTLVNLVSDSYLIIKIVYPNGYQNTGMLIAVKNGSDQNEMTLVKSVTNGNNKEDYYALYFNVPEDSSSNTYNIDIVDVGNQTSSYLTQEKVYAINFVSDDFVGVYNTADIIKTVYINQMDKNYSLFSASDSNLMARVISSNKYVVNIKLVIKNDETGTQKELTLSPDNMGQLAELVFDENYYIYTVFATYDRATEVVTVNLDGIINKVDCLSVDNFVASDGAEYQLVVGSVVTIGFQEKVGYAYDNVKLNYGGRLFEAKRDNEQNWITVSFEVTNNTLIALEGVTAKELIIPVVDNIKSVKINGVNYDLDGLDEIIASYGSVICIELSGSVNVEPSIKPATGSDYTVEYFTIALDENGYYYTDNKHFVLIVNVFGNYVFN